MSDREYVYIVRNDSTGTAFFMPEGFESNVTVHLWGAGGGQGYSSTSGGGGAYVTSTLSVSEGDFVEIFVGNPGTNGGREIGGVGGTSGASTGLNAYVSLNGKTADNSAPTGYNDDNNIGAGGGGGGATAIIVNGNVIVAAAGGGGGAGGSGYQIGTAGNPGGVQTSPSGGSQSGGGGHANSNYATGGGGGGGYPNAGENGYNVSDDVSGLVTGRGPAGGQGGYNYGGNTTVNGSGSVAGGNSTEYYPTTLTTTPRSGSFIANAGYPGYAVLVLERKFNVNIKDSSNTWKKVTAAYVKLPSSSTTVYRTIPPTTNTYEYGTHTFTVPAGIFSIDVDIVGGGGGSSSPNGGCNYGASNSGGGGGGSGGYRQSTLAVVPGDVINITVGGGGRAGDRASVCYYGTNGASGGDSSIQSTRFGTLTATGGTGATVGWEFNGGPAYGGNQANGSPGTRNGGYGGSPGGNNGAFGGNQGNPTNGAGGASPYNGYGSGGTSGVSFLTATVVTDPRTGSSANGFYVRDAGERSDPSSISGARQYIVRLDGVTVWDSTSLPPSTYRPGTFRGSVYGISDSGSITTSPRSSPFGDQLSAFDLLSTGSGGAGGAGIVTISYSSAPLAEIVTTGGWKQITAAWTKINNVWKSILSSTDVNSLEPTTQTYTSLLTNEFVVPAGCTKIYASLIGGGGGGGGDDSPYLGAAGFSGSIVKSVINVSPGDVLTIGVGGGGGSGASHSTSGAGYGGSSSLGFGGGRGGSAGSVPQSGAGGGGGAASVLKINNVITAVAAGGGGGAGGGHRGPANTTKPSYANSAAFFGSAGEDKSGDGGGAGGGGGGFFGGSGGTNPGGDVGSNPGSDGSNLVPPGGFSGIANNQGAARANGGNGSITISYYTP